MADMGAYLAFDVDYISMIPNGGELVACRHSVKVDDEDLAGSYELIWKLYQKVRIERYNLKQENAKLRKLIGAYHEYCLCNQYSKKSAHQLITEIEDMIRELGIEVTDA